MVGSIPSGGNFIFADFETLRCHFCTKMPEMSELCYLGKTRVEYKIAKRKYDFAYTDRQISVDLWSINVVDIAFSSIKAAFFSGNAFIVFTTVLPLTLRQFSLTVRYIHN